MQRKNTLENAIKPMAIFANKQKVKIQLSEQCRGKTGSWGQVRNTGQRLMSLIQIAQKNTAEKTLVQTNQGIGWWAQVSCLALASVLALQHLGNLADAVKFWLAECWPSLWPPWKVTNPPLVLVAGPRSDTHLASEWKLGNNGSCFFSSLLLFLELVLKKVKTNQTINRVTGLEALEANDCTRLIWS